MPVLIDKATEFFFQSVENSSFFSCQLILLHMLQLFSWFTKVAALLAPFFSNFFTLNFIRFWGKCLITAFLTSEKHSGDVWHVLFGRAPVTAVRHGNFHYLRLTLSFHRPSLFRPVVGRPFPCGSQRGKGRRWFFRTSTVSFLQQWRKSLAKYKSTWVQVVLGNLPKLSLQCSFNVVKCLNIGLRQQDR